MRMHTIEVDDEVFAYLKSQAEPLVDDANKVLRRLLLKDRPHGTRSPVTTNSNGHDGRPNIPAGTPMALREVLEVVQYIRNSGSTRRDATRYVAGRLNITIQSVLDKYTRQLGLTASQFDRLLEAGNVGELKSLLKQKFRAHGEVIDMILA